MCSGAESLHTRSGATASACVDDETIAKVAIRVEVPARAVKANVSLSLGLIVTELVTNACKYAYPDRPGEVRVALTRAGDDAFTLAVEDDGCGIMQDAGPRGTGLGTKLIRAMAQSLQSAVEYYPAHRGCRATLTAPIG